MDQESKIEMTYLVELGLNTIILCRRFCVDRDDIMPENITEATDALGHFNLMPVYGMLT